VTDRILSIEREAALVRLMDDPSPTVQRALREELRRLDDVGVSLLRKTSHSDDAELAAAAGRLLAEIEGPEPVAVFSRFIRSLEYELETGSILMNRVVRPDLEAERVTGQLNVIAERCMDLMVEGADHWERCKVINRVLFHEFGFRGNLEDYEDPMNSFIAAVLRRRKGIPISLGIVYLLVAQRCGVPLEPVSLPGRFMVACYDGPRPFFVDVFDRGRFRTPDEIYAALARAGGEAPVGVMGPAPVGEVLCRCCRNLAHHYSIKNNPRMAKIFAGFVREFEETYRRQAHS